MEVVMVTGALLLLLGLALATASTKGRHIGGDVGALVELSRLRSRSGTPFFPTEDAVWDLSGELDQIGEARPLSARP